MKLQEFRQRLDQDPEYLKAEEELRLQLHLADAVLKGRLNKGWSQTQLAGAVGTKQANISRIEAGLANPTLSLIRKILKVLSLDLIIQAPGSPPVYESSSANNSESILINNWPQNQPCSDVLYQFGRSSKTDQGI
jgi:ribosome-binding protein aMBF1 (putative translation factor)